MGTPWTSVRIASATLAELDRVKRSMLLADFMGLIELERDPRDRVSLDQVIRRLIAFRDRHAERARRSKARRAEARRRAADPSPDADA